MEPTPNRSKINARGIAIRTALFLAALVVVIGFLWATNVFGWRKWRINEVQQFIGVELPPAARDLQFATENAKTRVVWLRFAVSDETAMTSFVERLGFQGTLRQGFTPFPAANFNESALTWWTPFSAQQFGGLYAIHDGKTYELLLDQTDSANLTLYLRVYAIAMS